jgi:hypothetical protein
MDELKAIYQDGRRGETAASLVRLRDKFAEAALRSTGIDLYDMLSKGADDDIGICMYRIADSMMKARGK